MLVQLGCGFLSGVSITFLKDAYGPFVRAINFSRLIVVAFIPPVEDVSVKLIPLQFVSDACHFLISSKQKHAQPAWRSL